MRRIVRGIGALVGLLVGLVGVPVALVLLGADLQPESWSPTDLLSTLLRPDDGRLLVAMLTVVGWAAWLVFALSVLTELVALASRRRIRWRIPGLAAPQRLAASLLIAVIALAPAAPVAHADPLPLAPTADQPAATRTPVAVDQSPASTPTLSDPPAAGVERSTPKTDPDRTAKAGSALTHRVTEGDDLWSLAERYYGDGALWRKIAKANTHVLTGGPDRLTVGWRLTIPDPPTHGQVSSVTVNRGDTLSSIAREELGSSAQWPTLFRANRDVLDDPDQLAVGTALRVPDTDQSTTSQRTAVEKSTQKAGQDERHTTAPPASSGSSASSSTTSAPSSTAPAASPTDPAASPAAPSAPATGPAASSRPSASAASPTADQGSAADTTPTVPATPAGPEQADVSDGAADKGLAVYAGVGGLLAAGVLAGLAYRRRLQLQARPVGRRILHPDAAATQAEVALGARQQPLDLEALDTAIRAIGIYCRRGDHPLPRLSLVRFDPEAIDLGLTEWGDNVPLGFASTTAGWRVAPADHGYLASLPGIESAARPYPTLVELGEDDAHRAVLANLEELGLLSLVGEHDEATELLSALATELAFAPWNDELVLTVVGDRAGLPAALEKYNVTATEDVDDLLMRLESRADAQRDEAGERPSGTERVDPDLSDPWVPEVVLVRRPLAPEQQRRLVQLITREPRPTLAVVAVGEIAEAPWVLRLTDDGGVLEPAGLQIQPRRLPPGAEDAIVSAVKATGRQDTTPAPWWVEDDPPDLLPEETPPDQLLRTARRAAGWAADIDDDENGQAMAHTPVIGRDNPPDHPVLLMLGPIELVGEQGTPPSRAPKQCLEYCGWLLEHPGTTAQAMGAALLVAEGTRRSNMSRLRTWLGADEEGRAYLPDAYSGRIMLHAAVSSDWQRLQILTATGVNRASDSGLQAALDLVRGAPLADAAPGQWHWAEELRTDMISAVRDIGVELARRSNEAGDLDLARWAAARALAAAPGDELLMATRIRTEHLAGNRSETERLTLQLAAQARALGVDLELETIELLQQVMEGRVRARLA